MGKIMMSESDFTAVAHHAEGRVDPKVREHQNGFRFQISDMVPGSTDFFQNVI
jgi:hypothetical protein